MRLSFALGFFALVACNASSTSTNPSEPPPDDGTSLSGEPGTPEEKSPDEPEGPLTFGYSTIAMPLKLHNAVVGGSSATDIWVVGDSGSPSSARQAHHWDGTGWSTASFSPPLTMDNRAFGVTSLGGDVYIGFSKSYTDPNSSGSLYRFDGTKFVRVTTELREGLTLTAIGSNVVVGQRGNGGALFDGKTLVDLDGIERDTLWSAWGLSDSDIWLATDSGVGRLSTGKTYTQVADYFRCVQIAGNANDDVWVVAQEEGVKHFDGKKWHDVAWEKTVTETETAPHELAALSTSEVVATGYYDAYRLVGDAFVPDKRPNAPRGSTSSARVGKHEVWFVDDSSDASTKLRRLAPVTP